MGIHLVCAALSPDLATLADRARLTLLTMAAIAVDPDAHTKNGTPPGEYWGGHERLMIHVLGDIPPRDSVEYATAKRLISRYCTELTTAGLIIKVGGTGPGRTARYSLHPLDPRPPRSGEPVDKLSTGSPNGGLPESP